MARRDERNHVSATPEVQRSTPSTRQKTKDTSLSGDLQDLHRACLDVPVCCVALVVLACGTGVCEKTLLLGEPLPWKAPAETALQPLLWHSEGLSFQGYHFLEECFFRHRYVFGSLFSNIPLQMSPRGCNPSSVA